MHCMLRKMIDGINDANILRSIHALTAYAVKGDMNRIYSESRHLQLTVQGELDSIKSSLLALVSQGNAERNAYRSEIATLKEKLASAEEKLEEFYKVQELSFDDFDVDENQPSEDKGEVEGEVKVEDQPSIEDQSSKASDK